MNFNVGDKVQFKEWDEMVNEYGIIDGTIRCTALFPQQMKYLCGMDGIISANSNGRLYVTKGNGENFTQGYRITEDMIKNYGEQPIEITYEELMI